MRKDIQTSHSLFGMFFFCPGHKEFLLGAKLTGRPYLPIYVGLKWIGVYLNLVLLQHKIHVHPNKAESDFYRHATEHSGHIHAALFISLKKLRSGTLARRDSCFSIQVKTEGQNTRLLRPLGYRLAPTRYRPVHTKFANK